MTDTQRLLPVVESSLAQLIEDLPKDQLLAAIEAAHQAADRFATNAAARDYVRARVQEQFPAVPGFVANLLVELAVSLTRRGLTDLAQHLTADVQGIR